MNYEDINTRVEACVAECDAKVMKIAAEVREKLVVPLCKKHKFSFITGNGDFFFTGVRRGKQVRYGDAEDEDTPEYVRCVLRVLDIGVTHANHLGYYMEGFDNK